MFKCVMCKKTSLLNEKQNKLVIEYRDKVYYNRDEIRLRYNNNENSTKLSEEYNLHFCTIRRIINGKSWK